ncbi:MAG: hypothetical protein O7H41_21385 [Planctomycetota bacterium]|nr:hypothetical protein [Planctomycetota bacterium]
MTAKRIIPDSGESEPQRPPVTRGAVHEPGVADGTTDSPARDELGSDVSEDNKPNGQILEDQDPVGAAIQSIPENTSKTKLSMLLEPVLRQLAECDAPTAEAYLSYHIAPRFGLSAADLRAYRGLIETYRGESARANPSDADAIPRKILWKDERAISPAQDFLGDTAYYCVYRTEVTGPEGGPSQTVRVPCLVTSRREIFPLSVEELATRGLRLARGDLRPSDMRRWSVDPDVPNSVPAFLDGKARVDPLDLFDNIEGLYRRYLEFSNEHFYAFLTLWSIGTYLFMMFESYPYVSLVATMQAGKTLTMEVASSLCFNSVMAASISTASLYRSVEADRCTMFIDEADEYRSRRRKNADSFGILNSGYKRSGSVSRTDPRTGSMVSFSTFSPKMIANIEDLDPTTLDRAILAELVRAKKAMEEFMTKEMETELAALRNSLHVFALTNHSIIRRIYRMQRLPTAWFANRERELWRPIFALANFFDQHRQRSSPNLAEEDLLVSKMARLALDCGRLKADRQADETLEFQVLRGVVAFVDWAKRRTRSAATANGSIYRADSLLGFIRGQEKIRSLTQNALSRALQKLQILRGPKDKYYGRQGNGVRVMVYRLEPNRIQEALGRYGM